MLKTLISKSPSGFSDGKFIFDGIAVAQELMSAWMRQRKHKGALLKLDFAKAYDMLV